MKQILELYCSSKLSEMPSQDVIQSTRKEFAVRSAGFALIQTPLTTHLLELTRKQQLR